MWSREMWQFPVLTLREGKHFWLLKLLLLGWEAYCVRKQIPCVAGGWQLERGVGLVMVGRKSGVRSGLEKGLRKGRRPRWAWKEQKGGHRDVGYQGERKRKLEGRGELGLLVFFWWWMGFRHPSAVMLGTFWDFLRSLFVNMHPDRTGMALCDHNVAVGLVPLSQHTGSLTPGPVLCLQRLLLQ